MAFLDKSTENSRNVMINDHVAHFENHLLITTIAKQSKLQTYISVTTLSIVFSLNSAIFCGIDLLNSTTYRSANTFK